MLPWSCIGDYTVNQYSETLSYTDYDLYEDVLLDKV